MPKSAMEFDPKKKKKDVKSTIKCLHGSCNNREKIENLYLQIRRVTLS